MTDFADPADLDRWRRNPMTLKQAETIADAMRHRERDTADFAMGVLLDEVARLRAELQLAGTVALERKMQLDRLRTLVAMSAHDAIKLSEDLARASTEP